MDEPEWMVPLSAHSRGLSSATVLEVEASRTRYDAIVIGGGPVGSIAALTLARDGLLVALVEPNANVYPYPRAVNLDHFTLAWLRELLGQWYDKFDYIPNASVACFSSFDKLGEKPFASASFSSFAEKCSDKPVAEMNWFHQPNLEECLRNRIAEVSLIDVFYRHEAVQFYHGDDGLAHLTVRDLSHSGASGEQLLLRFTSTFVLGCDGDGSLIREQIGSRFIDLGMSAHVLVVDAKVDHTKFKTPESCGGYHILDKQRPATFLAFNLDSRARWEFRMNHGDDGAANQSPAAIYKLLEPFVDKEHVELVRHTIYSFKSVIATRWRSKNTFLCGDAAHQASPLFGQGLSIGLRNTVNLCRKIGLVFAGISEEELLDTYQSECYDPTFAWIRHSLFMRRLLFGPSCLFKVGLWLAPCCRSLDLVRAVTDKAVPLANGAAIQEICRLVAQLRVYTYGPATDVEMVAWPILNLSPTRYRVLAANIGVASTLLSALRLLPEQLALTVLTLLPSLAVLDTAPGDKAMVHFCAADPGMGRQLFRDWRYVLLGMDNYVFGVFADATELVEVYAAHQMAELRKI